MKFHFLSWKENGKYGFILILVKQRWQIYSFFQVQVLGRKLPPSSYLYLYHLELENYTTAYLKDQGYLHPSIITVIHHNTSSSTPSIFLPLNTFTENYRDTITFEENASNIQIFVKFRGNVAPTPPPPSQPARGPARPACLSAAALSARFRANFSARILPLGSTLAWRYTLFLEIWFVSWLTVSFLLAAAISQRIPPRCAAKKRLACPFFRTNSPLLTLILFVTGDHCH